MLHNSTFQPLPAAAPAPEGAAGFRIGLTRPVRAPRAGFALVVTLSMMMLLLVVGVGLLSLSVITLRGSGHGEARQIAQANARLGLMFALAQLQMDAGDDRSVTAAADIASASDKGPPPTNPAAGLTPPQRGSRFWTGVWQNSLPATQAATQIYNRTPQATHIRWLVSGGESGLITPDSPRIAVSEYGEVSASDQAVILVGPGSAGMAGAEDFVAVPLVEIAANGRSNAGRYGWWVGDEGVKTRFNLPSQDDASGVATYAGLGSRGGAWEVVDGFTAYPGRGSDSEIMLARVLTVPGAALLDRSLTAEDSALRHGFHDVTTDSRGLLTDTLSGGFRLDLSRYLEDGFPATSEVSTLPNAATATTNIIPRITARTLLGPRWEKLRTFDSMHRSLDSGALKVKAATNDSELTVAPILLDFRILMGGKLMPAGERSSEYRILPCGKVAVTLANPYPYPLRWDRDLEFQIFNESPAGNNPSRIFDVTGQPAFIPANPSEPAVFNNAVFTIPPGSLAPGEALAYTMTGPVQRPANTAKVTIKLGPFEGSSPASFDNSIIMDHNGVNTGSKLLDVRESWTTSLISVELRASGGGSGGGGILRRVERLELDNAFYATTKRQVDGVIARRLLRPFPLHLFSFHISQPGVDYAALLPSSNALGSRNSTLRTFTDFNLQAIRFTRPITAYNSPPYFMESSDSLASLPFEPGGNTGNGFTRNLAISPIAWGRSASGPKKSVLFSPPSQLVSLAQFQHADLTADDRNVSIGHQPGNAVGNSYASPFVKRSLSLQLRRDYVVLGSPNPSGARPEPRTYYDLSYLLNASLWDTYFLSTIPSTGSPIPLQPDRPFRSTRALGKSVRVQPERIYAAPLSQPRTSGSRVPST